MRSVRDNPEAYDLELLWWQQYAGSSGASTTNTPPSVNHSVRRIPLNRRSVTGRTPSLKLGRMIAYESTLERDLFDCLEFDFNVTSYQEQPLCIRYVHDGQVCTYTPDALVQFATSANRKSAILEVKYARDLIDNWQQYHVPLSAARNYARHHRLDFVVKTERDIRTPYLQNAKLLLPYRRARINRKLAFELIRVINRKPQSVGDLIEHARNSADAETARTAVLYLIAIGAFSADLYQLLDETSQVVRGHANP